MTRVFLALALVALAAGCNNPVEPVDAPMPMADAPPLMRSAMFRPCSVDAQCEHLGLGAFCSPAEDGWPGGYCTRPCTDRTPCEAFGSYHNCVIPTGATEGVCVRRCRNGLDCDTDGWTCDPTGGPTGDDGMCLPVCASDEECGGTAVCNRDSGRCEAPPVDVGGAPHGSPCANATDCRSRFCSIEGTATNPSGWVGGMCLGNCRIADGFNTTNFFSGDTLPAGTCVEGAVCIPGNGYAEGDLGTCYDDCTVDGDCRTGYGCRKTFGDSTFTNGICVPRDCRAGGCPADYRCLLVTLSDGSQVGRCAPNP